MLYGSFGCVSSLDIPLPSGGRLPGLKPSSEGLELLPGAWGALKWGMPTVPGTFMELPVTCELRPCDLTHLKNDLVPYSYAFACMINTSRFFFYCDIFYSVGGVQSSGRGVCCTVRLGVSHHWIYLWLQWAVPQAFTLLGGVRLIAWRLRHLEKGNTLFWNCLSRVGYGLATGPT